MTTELEAAIHESTTPSGVEIRFTESPRKYEIRKDSEWREVPSVTTVLDKTMTPPLGWWGQGKGISGVLALVGLGLLQMGSGRFLVHSEDGREATQKSIEFLMGQVGLTTNSHRDSAAERGTAAHSALELWATHGLLVDAASYPENQRTYVEGVLKFIAEGDSVETDTVEVLVGSLEHGFAGRYDWRGKLEGVPTLLDLKTGKRVYKKHYLQLEAYELASVECGYEPTEQRLVLHVDEHGEYTLHKSKAKAETFLHLLRAYPDV